MRRVVRRLPLEFRPNALALDPEGRRLAVNNYDPTTRSGEAAGRDPRPRNRPRAVRPAVAGRQRCNGLERRWAIAGDRRHTGDAHVYVWNVRRGALTSVLQGHTGYGLTVRFAHSGYLLATSSWDGTTRLWDGVSGEPLAMAPGNLRGWFAPDDRRLAFRVGGKVGVWDVAVAPECRTLHPGMLGNRSEATMNVGVMSADVSPDGRLIATGDGDGVRLWEADTGRELAHLKSGYSDTVLFHPDGESLITQRPVGPGSLADPARSRWRGRTHPDRSARVAVGEPVKGLGHCNAGCPIVERWH